MNPRPRRWLPADSRTLLLALPLAVSGMALGSPFVGLIGDTTLAAQEPAPKPPAETEAGKPGPETLTLQRIYGSSQFSARSYSATWLDDNRYVRWERSRGPNGGRDLVAYDPRQQGPEGREVLIHASRLVPTGSTTPLAVSSYAFSPDRSKVLIYTNTKRVWRRNTRGDYWVLDRSSHELKQIGGELPPSSLMFAKLSPDGRQVAFVHANDIWVQDVVGDSPPRQLTTSGSETIINGTFDWVYEEELGLRDGFRWSPDGAAIAYWQLNSEGVRRFPLVNNISGLYPSIQWIPYPKTGQRNSAARIGVVAVQPQSPSTMWLQIPGDPRQNYLARMEWHADHGKLIIQQLNRLQNRNRVYEIDGMAPPASAQQVPRVGAPLSVGGSPPQSAPDFSSDAGLRLLLEETDDAWVEIQDSLTWRDDAFLWLSERSGMRQLYLLDRGSAKLTALTEGFAGDVIALARDTETALYFYASPDNATQRYLYQVKPGRKSAPQRVTPDDQPGTHQYRISPDGHWALHTWSQFDKPPTVELIRLPSHETFQVLEDNHALRQRLQKLADKRPATELFSVEIEAGVELDGWCIRPAELKPGQRHPLLIYVYGEPAGTTVRDAWGGSTQMWHRMLAQRGYVVMSFDNRGTPAPRGRQWRKACYRQVGILAPRDQAAAVREVLAQRDYLDPSRVGVWGWSGGGSMTLNALLKFPDLYQVGISIAAVPNQRFYDTIYQERYMGLPSDNPQGYHDGSAVNFAANLKGELLLIHGTGDDNCHYQGAEAMIHELIRHNKQFTMMSYPNRSHSIREGVNTSRHLRTLMTNFLYDKLPAGPRD